MHAMGAYLRAHGASAIYGCPVCHTGRCEQWTSYGVKDGPGPSETGSTVDERVIHPPGHTALRRRIAGGVLGSPQAVGGRLGVSRRPVAARADCPFGGRCKLVVSSAPVRQLAPRTQPARAPNQPGTLIPHSTRTFTCLPKCVCPSPGSPRAGRFWQPEADAPRAPPPAPPASPDGRWRTAVTLTARRHDGPPPSPPPPSSIYLHRRQPRHRLASTALHAHTQPLHPRRRSVATRSPPPPLSSGLA